MSRGQVKLETFQLKRNGPGVDIYLNKDGDGDSEDGGKLFYCHIGEKRYSANSLKELKTLIRHGLENASQVVWVPVIEITANCSPLLVKDCDRLKEGVILKLDRFYIAKVQEEWMKTDWMPYESKMTKEDLQKERFERSEKIYCKRMPIDGVFAEDVCVSDLTHISGHSIEVEWMVPYNEELWCGLKLIQDGIQSLNRKIFDLINTKAGRQRVMKAASEGTLLLNQSNAKPAAKRK